MTQIETPKPRTANQQIVRASLIVMAGYALANIVGLFLRILIANVFGTGVEIDAYYAAERLPNMLFLLVAGGALASAFIPNFTDLLENKKQQDAWRLASAIVNLVLIVLLVLSVLAAIFAPTIISTLIAPDFTREQQALTANLLRIMLISSSVFAISGLVMGILNSHQRFIAPAFAPTMLWVGIILGVWFLVPSMGIYGLAWGYVLGSLMHLLTQVPALIRLPSFKYTPWLGLRDKAVHKVGILMGPRLIGVAAVQINLTINVLLASGMPPGSLTSITIAFAIMTMPQAIIAQAISNAALPTFAAQFARGDIDGLRASLAGTIRSILFLSLPATIGLILLRAPVVSMLFERGEFDAQSVALTSWALLWYTVGLVGHSLVEILSRAFYALHDTKTPVAVGALAMLMNIGFSLLFAHWFEQNGLMPHGGLALANSVATTLEMFALIWLMRRRLNGIEGRMILVGSLQAGLAVGAMSAALWWWIGLVAGSSVWLIGIGGVAIGGLVYAVIMILLPVPEVQGVVKWGLAKIRIS